LSIGNGFGYLRKKLMMAEAFIMVYYRTFTKANIESFFSRTQTLKLTFISVISITFADNFTGTYNLWQFLELYISMSFYPG
jgi:hypothetical protein